MPSPCAAETGIGSPSPSPWKSCASDMSRGGVDLVRREHDRELPAAQESAISSSPGRQPGARVDDEHGHLRVGERRARLVLDRDRERIVVVEVDAAGVDQRERAPVPLGLELLAVARDARALVHDRLARLREPVDERGLADIRIADDGDLHASISFASTTSVRIWSSTPSRSSVVVSTGTASFAAISGECSRALVALVALELVLQHGLVVGAELLGAPPGAHLGRGGEEDLDLRVRAHDGADVAALGDPVAVLEDLLLLAHERHPHADVGADLRGRFRDRGRADRVGDVTAVEQHAVAQLDLERLGDLGRLAAPLAHGERDAAIHRARVEISEAQPLGGGAGDG